MKRFKITRYIIAICLLVSVCCVADAAPLPLTDKIPADSLVYVGWAGSDALQQAYDDSHLKAVLSASNFTDVIAQLIPQLINKIPGDPQDKQKVQLIHDIAAKMWKHPTAFYLREISPASANNPDFRPVLLCDAGADAPALLDLFQKNILANNTQNVIAGSSGTLVWLASDDEHPGQTPQALNTDPSFTSVMTRLQPAPAFVTYINVQSALSKTDAMADHDPTARRIWPAVRDALGLTHVTVWASTNGFDGPDWMSSSCLLASSPRTGLLAAVEPMPADPERLARVPQTANLVTLTNFDAGKFLDSIDAAFSTDQRSAAGFHKVLGAANILLGRNLRRQILATFGSQWILYSPAPLKFVLLNKLTDPTAAADSLVSALYGISATVNTQLGQKNGPIVTVDQKPIQGITVTTVTVANLPSFAPSMAINKGILYFAMSPDEVASAATAPDAADADITHRPEFASAAQRLNAPAIAGFTFANLPQTAVSMYPALTHGLGYLGLLAQNNALHLPPIVLPPIDQLQSNLSPALSVTWADADGIYSKSISPFPASTILGNSPDQLTTIGTTALTVSVILPSLNRARETANRVQCASNERQIGQAILLYANENKGIYPPDLGTLLKTEDITPQVFICPSSNNKVPANLKSRDQLAQWVNDHADYIYVGKGLTTNLPANQIVLCEKPDAHSGDGMNVLYGDGHVEFQRMDHAKQLIQQQQDNGDTSPPGEHGL